MDANIQSVAIGSFDGIHLGHQKLIDMADALVIIERNTGYLTPGYRRSFFTSKVCCFYHFDAIKSLTPEEFVLKLQEDFPDLQKIVVGYDFGFGKAKSGDIFTLKKLFSKDVVIVEEVKCEEISIHSRTIKSYLTNGNIDMANRLLGREYQVLGSVVRGQGLGNKELVATINLKVKSYKLPMDGVYATRTEIEGKSYSSISFLGHRITTDGEYAVETHILDEIVEVLSGEITISFVSFLRSNKKFETLALLKSMISEDILRAKDILC